MTPWVGVHVGLEASVSRGGCQRGEGGASFAGFNWRRLRVRFGAASGEAYALSCRRGQRERRFGGLMAAMWLMGRRVSWIGRERHGGGCRRGESPGEGHTLATGGCGERRRGGAAKGHARRHILCRLGAGAGRTRGVAGRSACFGSWWLRREAARRRGERARAAAHPLPAWGWRRREPRSSRERRSACCCSLVGRRGAAKRRCERMHTARPRMWGAVPALHEQRVEAEGNEAADGGQAGLEEGGTRGGCQRRGAAHLLSAWDWRKRGESPGGRGRRAGTCDGVAATSGEVPALGSWPVMRGRRGGAMPGRARHGR
jgi:hypothetical protein